VSDASVFLWSTSFWSVRAWYDQASGFAKVLTEYAVLPSWNSCHLKCERRIQADGFLELNSETQPKLKDSDHTYISLSLYALYTRHEYVVWCTSTTLQSPATSQRRTRQTLLEWCQPAKLLRRLDYFI
jgi:hypothetical protein